jgi:hypothetical protein
MADRPTFSLDRTTSAFAVLAVLLAVTAILEAPLAAQSVDSQVKELDRKVKEVQTSLDELKKTVERNEQLARVAADVESIKRTVETRRGIESFPEQAWTTFVWLGFFGAVGWCFVNWQREKTGQEAAKAEQKKMDENSFTVYVGQIDQEVKKRMDTVVRALEACRTSPTPKPDDSKVQTGN